MQGDTIRRKSAIIPWKSSLWLSRATAEAAAKAFGETTRSMSRDQKAEQVKEKFADENGLPGTFEKMTAVLPSRRPNCFGEALSGDILIDKLFGSSALRSYKPRYPGLVQPRNPSLPVRHVAAFDQEKFP